VAAKYLPEKRQESGKASTEEATTQALKDIKRAQAQSTKFHRQPDDAATTTTRSTEEATPPRIFRGNTSKEGCDADSVVATC
jgi:hypothetical protein